MAVTADMTLTAALIVFLHRSRTGLKRYALPRPINPDTNEAKFWQNRHHDRHPDSVLGEHR